MTNSLTIFVNWNFQEILTKDPSSAWECGTSGNIPPCGVVLRITCRCTEFHRVKNANMHHPSCTVVTWKRKSASPVRNVLSPCIPSFSCVSVRITDFSLQPSTTSAQAGCSPWICTNLFLQSLSTLLLVPLIMLSSRTLGTEGSLLPPHKQMPLYNFHH